ncbi:LysR family transcriptional regulator [Pseudomonas sp.]|uniref:LysR family transcriptional regulator n=1 Tax=Pseudomonas sp. TaxID=306 RepID=UPI003A973659
MQITTFRYFLAVAETGSVRQAAENLHVSASAISRQIQNLEHSFRSTLFERRPSGMHLTEEGIILAQHMRRTIREMELARARIDDVHGLITGTIRYATIEGVVQSWLFPAFATFQEQYPGVTFEGDIMGSEAVHAALKTGHADFGIAMQTAPYTDLGPSVDVLQRIETRFRALMKADHPLASRERLTLNDLEPYRLAMLGPSFQTRRQIDIAALHQGLNLNIRFELNHIELLKRYVQVTGEITVLPDYALRHELEDERMTVIDIHLRDIPPSSTILCVQKGHCMPRATEVFLSHLQDQNIRLDLLGE